MKTAIATVSISGTLHEMLRQLRCSKLTIQHCCLQTPDASQELVT